MIPARRARAPSSRRARRSSHDFNTHHRIVDRASIRSRARSRSRALQKKFHPPDVAHTTARPPRPRASHTRSHPGRSPRARASDFDRFARARARHTRTSARPRTLAHVARADRHALSPRARARRARARRRREFAARAFKIEPARVARGQGMKRSRDDGPGAGAAIKRCARDAMRSRCDRASTTPRATRARATRRRRATRDSIRDEIGAEFSCRLRRDGAERPTDDRRASRRPTARTTTTRAATNAR